MTDLPPRHPVGFAGGLLRERGINRLSFASAEEFLGAGAVLVDETGRESLSGAGFLLTAQATRALHTFEAVIATAQIGRGVQAAMLNRSLFDDVLDLHWVAENPEQAVQRAGEHDRLIALAEHRLETKCGRTDRHLTAEEESELDGLVELYGGARQAFGAPWHRASFNECFALLKERWKDEQDAAGYLDYLFELTQRRNNLMLHPSPTAYRQTIATRADGSHQLNRIGPDAYWRRALQDGCGAFYLAMRVLAQAFGFDKQRMAERFDRTVRLLIAPSDLPGLTELPAEASCPCGTGAPVGECHGS